MNKQKHLVANWKMNLGLQGITDFVKELASFPDTHQLIEGHERVAIAPQFIHLDFLKNHLFEQFKKAPIAIFAQNCSAEKKGAFTGEISPTALADCGVEGVILGHSERRQQHQESDQLIFAKCQAAISEHLSVIYCVGETLQERQTGSFKDVISKQLKLLTSLAPESLKHLTIAYEPVWAIGTGQVAGISEIQDVHALINSLMPNIPLLYGGSVTPENWAGISAIPLVDGALVGGASLKASSFYQLLRSSTHNR